MDWNKAKNLIIFLLVLVNVFLLGNMAYLAYKKEAASRTAVTELTAYLASVVGNFIGCNAYRIFQRLAA